MEPYNFDASEIIVEFNARPSAATPAIVAHKLRRPTLEELLARERASAYEMIEVEKNADEIRVDDEAANVALWEKVIVAVRGYGGADWQTLDDAQIKEMRASHKTTAIRGMYQAECDLLDDEGEITLSAQTWRILQTFGSGHTVTHTLREWTESERQRFKRASSSTRNVRGSRKAHVQVLNHLKAYVELFDALWQGCEGGAISGHGYTPESRGVFLAQIDPIWKQQIVRTLTGAMEAQLRD